MKLPQGTLERQLRQALAQARACRASYDAASAFGVAFEADRIKQLSREIVKADSHLCAIAKQLLAAVLGDDAGYEFRVSLSPGITGGNSRPATGGVRFGSSSRE